MSKTHFPKSKIGESHLPSANCKVASFEGRQHTSKCINQRVTPESLVTVDAKESKMRKKKESKKFVPWILQV
jgi:hypothetical protein